MISDTPLERPWRLCVGIGSVSILYGSIGSTGYVLFGWRKMLVEEMLMKSRLLITILDIFTTGKIEGDIV